MSLRLSGIKVVLKISPFFERIGKYYFSARFENSIALNVQEEIK